MCQYDRKPDCGSSDCYPASSDQIASIIAVNVVSPKISISEKLRRPLGFLCCNQINK